MVVTVAMKKEICIVARNISIILIGMETKQKQKISVITKVKQKKIEHYEGSWKNTTSYQ